MDGDYKDFVERMGSFDMDLSDIGKKEEKLTHFIKSNTKDELTHFGIKGMKWGKRKSQNKPFKERTYADMFMPTKKMADKANAKSAERRSKKTEKKMSDMKKLKDKPAPKKSYLTDDEKNILDKTATNIRINMLKKQGRDDAARELKGRQITKELFGENDQTASRLRSKMLEKRGQTDAAREVKTQSIIDEIFGD